MRNHSVSGVCTRDSHSHVICLARLQAQFEDSEQCGQGMPNQNAAYKLLTLLLYPFLTVTSRSD